MGTSVFEDKRIILGITGSIASYKAVDLASSLTKVGAKVDVIMTEASERFITPLSFRSVTGRKVISDMWSLEDHVQHVNLGEAADIFVIAPATAHTIAKIAAGLADNLLTVTALASRCPLVVAPAMDAGMYTSLATQANVKTLLERGVQFIGPVEGRMASGLMGIGRMVEPAELMGSIRYQLGREGPLKGKKVLVTAGPTREAIDPVRFLSNYSSGKQGYALAQAALDLGANVTLVSGPVKIKCPVGITLSSITSAEEMSHVVLGEIVDTDILLMAAAVADFRPSSLRDHKFKKNQADDDGLDISWVSNPDILGQVKEQRGESGRPTITLGFAAETENLLENAKEKLEQKKLDFIAVNDVGAADRGFDSDQNEVVLVGSDGRMIEIPLQSKSGVADSIMGIVTEALFADLGKKDNG
jgi:phosphopantothenoylcysteine decarboxylase/phosphopantothenate--cysteine ligase